MTIDRLDSMMMKFLRVEGNCQDLVWMIFHLNGHEQEDLREYGDQNSILSLTCNVNHRNEYISRMSALNNFLARNVTRHRQSLIRNNFQADLISLRN
jgi:hypothetical protein